MWCWSLKHGMHLTLARFVASLVSIAHWVHSCEMNRPLHSRTRRSFQWPSNASQDSFYRHLAINIIETKELANGNAAVGRTFSELAVAIC